MPDRELLPNEMENFLYEKTTGKIEFFALKAILKEKTEPSLHDLCIHELQAIVEGQRRIITQQGRDLTLLTKDVENKGVILQTQNDVLQSLLKRVKALEEKKI